LKHLSILAPLLFMAPIASATLITHNDYTLNQETNIISHGNIEWLQWDTTLNMSINDFYNDAILSGMWSIANTTQVANLYNDWFTDNSGLDTTAHWEDDVIDQHHLSYKDQAHVQFSEIFGTTFHDPCIDDVVRVRPDGVKTITATCPREINSTMALFLGFNGGSATVSATNKTLIHFKEHMVYTDPNRPDSINYYSLGEPAGTWLGINPYDLNYRMRYRGLALVRTIPEPSSFLLLASGILMLAGRRRQVT